MAPSKLNEASLTPPLPFRLLCSALLRSALRAAMMQTLVLQDRKWDETNSRIFPKTTQLLQDIGVRFRIRLSPCLAWTFMNSASASAWPALCLLMYHTHARHVTNTTQHNMKAPTVEVFFAKQSPKTGIQPHSDGCNFVLTAVGCRHTIPYH